MKHRLYIHVGQATHFLAWERKYWARHFELVDSPGPNTIVMAFGPDAMESALSLPAGRRYITTFPGFRHNPLYNLDQRAQHTDLLSRFDGVFVNRGPLELAYAHLENLVFYPFSVDVDRIPWRPRRSLRSLLHVSADSPQKDWERSQEIMRLTGLPFEVFPPREAASSRSQVSKGLAVIRRVMKPGSIPPPPGYVKHATVMKKYVTHDGFVHIARDFQDPRWVDGKYTASLIEAGVSGSLLFWHDTFALGNEHETVFDLPLDHQDAANAILDIAKSVDVPRVSRATREEMCQKYHPSKSVELRADYILRDL